MYTMVILHRRHKMFQVTSKLCFVCANYNCISQHNYIVLNTMPEESFLRDKNTIMYAAFNKPFFVFDTKPYFLCLSGKKLQQKLLEKHVLNYINLI